MVEYLERKAVEEALEEHLNPDIYYGFILDDIPSADVQPVKLYSVLNQTNNLRQNQNSCDNRKIYIHVSPSFLTPLLQNESCVVLHPPAHKSHISCATIIFAPFTSPK